MAKSSQPEPRPESLPDGTPIATYRNGERLEGTIVWQAADTYSVLFPNQEINQIAKRECEENN